MFDLAVVIVSWNVRDLLAGCLRSLFDDLERSQLEAAVWVVDNASSDGTPAMVASSFPDVHLIASNENLGFAGGNNLALRQALDPVGQGPGFIWLLNPDTKVLPGATEALVAALEAHSGAGVAGAKLLGADGSLQHSAFRFPGLAQLVFELSSLPARLYDTPLNGRYSRRLYVGSKPFPVDHPLGASMMVRSEAVAQVGLMDEEYRLYCEEIDWCWRMRRAGWGAVCVPTARVVHHSGQSTGQAVARSFVDLWTSRARLYSRFHGPLKRRLARALVRARIARRAPGEGGEKAAACEQVQRAWEDVG
ncbi:MAG: glycosyltransferase family 2 protein [Anaerolineales bacterium]|nr:MAG: glycosyltransferase family 2 protein [Anaerolineales bacterium]